MSKVVPIAPIIPLKKSGILDDYYERKLYKKIEKQIIFLIAFCAFIKWCQERNINIRLFF